MVAFFVFLGVLQAPIHHTDPLPREVPHFLQVTLWIIFSSTSLFKWVISQSFWTCWQWSMKPGLSFWILMLLNNKSWQRYPLLLCVPFFSYQLWLPPTPAWAHLFSISDSHHVSLSCLTISQISFYSFPTSHSNRAYLSLKLWSPSRSQSALCFQLSVLMSDTSKYASFLSPTSFVCQVESSSFPDPYLLFPHLRSWVLSHKCFTHSHSPDTNSGLSRNYKG